MKSTAQLLIFIINSYVFLLMARVILSWLNIPSSQLILFLNKVTDPVINFFKKNFPIRIGALDISIIVPFILLSIIKKVLMDIFILEMPFGIFYIIGLILIILDSAVSFISFILFISTAALLVISINSPHITNPLINSIKMIIDPIINYIKRLIKIDSPNADKIYLIITGITIIVAGIIIHSLLMFSYDFITSVEASSMFQRGKLDIEF